MAKKLHKLKQQEMILKQERSNQLRLEALQKLQLANAAEPELIHQLEHQKREQEVIDALGEEYMYQNTPVRKGGVKAKAKEQGRKKRTGCTCHNHA